MIRSIARRLAPHASRGPPTRCPRQLPRRTVYSASASTRPTSHPRLAVQHKHHPFHSSSHLSSIFPFKLHDIGEGITEVEILKWHVQEGQMVEEFDSLCEAQSDKSVVEITSPASGTVKRLHVEAGTMIKVGQTLCDIATSEEVEGEPSTSPGDPAQSDTSSSTRPTIGQGEEGIRQKESPAVAEAEELSEELEKQAEHETAPGSQPSHRGEELLQSRDEAMEQVGSARFSGEASILPSGSSSYTPRPHPLDLEATLRRPPSSTDSYERKPGIRTSPAVRTLALKLGVELSEVKGTGENGRVTRDDVQAFADSGTSEMSAFQGERTAKDPSSQRSRLGKREEMEEMTRMDFGRTRKVMFKAMGAMGSVPHFGYTHTLNLTPLLPYMKAFNAPTSPTSKAPYLASDVPAHLSREPPMEAERPPKIGILALMVKSLLLALEEHPIMRSKLVQKGEDKWLEIRRDASVGIAVSDPKYGLLTPTLPPLAPSSSLGAINSALSALRSNASKPSPPPGITVSSVGPLGESISAMPVLPPGGGVAICAIGRARWEAEWQGRDGLQGKSVWAIQEGEVREGGMKPVLRCGVGWSGDHRVLEGAELIAFTESWRKIVEEPWRWLRID